MYPIPSGSEPIAIRQKQVSSSTYIGLLFFTKIKDVGNIILNLRTIPLTLTLKMTGVYRTTHLMYSIDHQNRTTNYQDIDFYIKLGGMSKKSQDDRFTANFTEP
jgi:hypothetical protein